MSDENAKTFEPHWNDAPGFHRQRCPQCGSTQLNGRRFTLNTAAGESYHLHEIFCEKCNLFEYADNLTSPEPVSQLHERWADPRAAMTRAEWNALIDNQIALRDKHEREERWPPDPDKFWTTEERNEIAKRRFEEKSFADNAELVAAVVASPDDDVPRRNYSTWMRRQERRTIHSKWFEGDVYKGDDPAEIANFVDAQLAIATGYRADPKFDAGDEMMNATYRQRPRSYGDDVDVMGQIFKSMGFHRGFMAEGAMQTRFFIMFSEELFRRAPIQHLTLTYCTPQLEQLVAMPALRQLRSLRLPERSDENKHMRLNGLTDHSIRLLASSPHLGGLTYLDLEDATALSARAMDYLALSPYLTSLSHVRLQVWGHIDHLQHFGIQTERGSMRDHLAGWSAELEQRHGYLPWLHADKYYGTSSPSELRVSEHPVGKASFRPDIAALARPRLAPALVDAILGRIDITTNKIRDRALYASLPEGRLVGTLERVAPAPGLESVAVHVTFSVQQAPSGVAVFDQATQRPSTLAARSTVTLVVPTFLVNFD